jgi:hypothetical protein
MRSLLRLAWATALFAIVGSTVGVIATARAAGHFSPVVVELFTSEGCNSCPPADAYLGELAKRPGILALSWHVDYWDYIGWKDPFAQHDFTLRQRAYSRSLAQRYVYTPQMVINGRLQGIGSERDAIERLITAAQQQEAADAAHAPRLTVDGDKVHVEGGPAAPSVVWAAWYDPQDWTPVKSGENAGRRLGEFNVVRKWAQLGRYDGKPVTLKLGTGMDDDEKAGCAIVVQQQTPAGPGAVLAAYAIAPPATK